LSGTPMVVTPGEWMGHKCQQFMHDHAPG